MSDPIPNMDLLDRMLRHDAWATSQLLQIAATLSDECLDRSFNLGHQTIRQTFEHTIWNIECWTDLMTSDSVRERDRDGTSISQLTERHAHASQQLYRFAREIADGGRLNESYVDHLDSPPRRKSIAGTLLHLATHGVHHRAQVRFMLRQCGITNLPDDDALTWEGSIAGGWPR